MAQHFLLSAQARTLSVAKVARMSDDEARATFRAIRRAETDGEPFCPRRGCLAVYEYASRPIFKCKGCGHQFSDTSSTIFASRKPALRDYLLAIALFVNSAKGMAALQLSRDLDVQYKTVFVLAHKLREAVSAEATDAKLSGEVEIEGAYFGGSIRKENKAEERVNRRKKEYQQTGKRRSGVVMRERTGRALPFVFRGEDDSVPTIRERDLDGAHVFADEASGWDELHAYYNTSRINHSIAFSDDGVCTNQAESYFARLRCAEIGTHHHISGRYLHAYATEMAWRENYRREPNGALYQLVASSVMAHPLSRQWSGYWQRAAC
ncbi:IS1595 family transposase [Ferruginivarius sediminum]|uniref:IS1595 family transposase n=1 Tax=Ferruginivarius sediminum TaxID=2661937 RepID=A0A369T4X3_9PROT|nr:IS1595 family transposase [Ferruginivarius sediminum]RDD60369.1 IS1595 family transposase [Ferruginivarius sediminum]